MKMTAPNTGSELEMVTDELYPDQIDMLEALSRIPDLRVKSQQQGEKDLSKEERLEELKEVFVKSPLQFLTRFGKHLEEGMLKNFEKFQSNEAIYHYLKRLERSLSSDSRKLRLKNRRYAALQKLVDTTDYFTEEEMQRRNPILFDQLIGKYHTKGERDAFLARSEKVTASCSKTPLTDLLMVHLDRNEEGQSYRRLDQERQKADEEAADAEYVNDEFMDHEDDEPVPRSGGGGPSQRDKIRVEEEENENGEEIEDEEKELFKEEFFTTMYRIFLEGNDTEFDYSTVDNNEEYDVGENLELDEEEKYFEDEEPQKVMSESSSETELAFKPPVRSSDLISKIQTLAVNSECEISSSAMTMDEEEDELDKYMKEIEKQLKNS